MSQQEPLHWFIRFLQRRNGVTDRHAHLTKTMTTTLERLAATASASPTTNATTTV